MGNRVSKRKVNFLKKIDIDTGDTVLDLGEHFGHYSIPATIVLRKSGSPASAAGSKPGQQNYR